MRELPELSESAARDEKISSAESSSMSFVVGSLDDVLSIGVEHLPHLDCFGGELLPLVEPEERGKSRVLPAELLSCLSGVSPLALVAEVVL